MFRDSIFIEYKVKRKVIDFSLFILLFIFFISLALCNFPYIHKKTKITSKDSKILYLYARKKQNKKNNI